MSEIRKQNQLSPEANRDNKRVRYTEDGTVVTTLLLRSLGKEVTAAQLYDYFSTFGPVDNVRITSFGYTTFAYVKFTHPESAAQALDMKQHSFAGHVTSVALAASQEESIKDDLPVELRNVTGTSLVDLNEDCLLKMFSSNYLELMDLCSVAETCSRLKGVAMGIFRREHKVWHFYEYEDEDEDEEPPITIDDARRIFFNFGSVISEVNINSTGSSYLKERTDQIMDLVITYCTNTLESLILESCAFDESMRKRLIPLFNRLTKLYLYDLYIGGDCKDLFANCESLVELTIFETHDYYGNKSKWFKKIADTTFPKLKKFESDHAFDDSIYKWKNFILRHKTLRTLSLDEIDCSHILPVIAENYSQLQKLKIICEGTGMSSVDFEKALESLLVLGHLKVLKIEFCDKHTVTVTKFIGQLHRLKSLEFLELNCARNVCEFISELSQLNKLKVLRFTNCYGPKNLNLLGNLDRLTELKVYFVDARPALDWNVVGMVERLIHLETLEIGIYGFEKDRVSYNGIVRAVQGRPDAAKRTLVIKCDRNFSLEDNDDNRRRIVID